MFFALMPARKDALACPPERTNVQKTRSDPGLLRALPHLAGFALPPVLVAGGGLGGVWTLLPLVLLLGVLPVVDWLAGINPRNADDDEPQLTANVWFRAITWLWLPVQIATIGWAITRVAAGDLNGVEVAGLVVSTGMIAGTIGITFAHELIHRPGAFERASSR